jgi:hypothetical protein
VAVYPRYSAMLQQSIGSFAPLTDPAVLAIQPDRIRIVRTPEAMTLTEFQRRWPSTIPLAELATINRLPSADVTIPAGTTIKRVTGG